MTDLPIMAFESAAALHAWLEANHARSSGIWLRIFKKHASAQSVSFEDVLDAGLCFDWSESSRRSFDQHSYLQRFTPRKARGTQSPRNRQRAQLLIEAGRMAPAGLRALGLGSSDGPERDTSTLDA